MSPMHKAIPQALSRRGLHECHTYPLVSYGKRRGRKASAFRVPSNNAWRYPSIELRSANAWTAMIIDCDGPDSVRSLHDAVTSGDVPWPNWIAERRSNGNCHAAWLFRQPVLRGERARQRPQDYAARVNEYYRHRLAADPGYKGVLTHNPLPVHDGGIIGRWGSDEPYELDTLAKVIPLGWKKPKIATTGIGRNCDLFNALMKWAGSPKNLNNPVLTAAIIANQDMAGPQGALPDSEVRAIARSVERYRRQWVAQGKFVDLSREAVSERQRERNKKSVAARRAKNAERDAAIVRASQGGMSQSALARVHGLTQPGVRKIILRAQGGKKRP